MHCRSSLVRLIVRMDPILSEIDKALKNKGLSAAAASKLAAGHYSLIKNMKSAKAEGKRYSVETLEKLAGVLDLELYFGPPRDTPAPPASIPAHSTFSETETLPRHGFAKCGIDGWGKEVGDTDPLPRPLDVDDTAAFYVRASGRSMIPEGIDGGTTCLVSPAQEAKEGDRVWLKDKGGKTAIKRLVKYTDKGAILRGWQPIRDEKQESFDQEVFFNWIDLIYPVIAVYKGRVGSEDARLIPDPRLAVDTAAAPASPAVHPATLNDEDFALIHLHDVQASAGPGKMALDGEVVSSLAFPRIWLRHNGINANNASLIFVGGNSMEPTFKDGSIVLINQNRTRLMPRRIYAFRDGDELYIKRLEKLDAGLIIHSDNPDYETRILTSQYDLEQITLIGEVVWSAGRMGK